MGVSLLRCGCAVLGARVDPLETTAGQQPCQRLVRFFGVRLDEVDRLLFETSERLGDQQPAEPLTAVLFDDVDVGQPDGAGVPLGEELVEPDKGQRGDQFAAVLLEQLEPDVIESADPGIPPPVTVVVLRRNLNPHPSFPLDTAKVDRYPLVQLEWSLEDGVAVGGVEAPCSEEFRGPLIGGQETGRLAASVQAAVERISSRTRPGVDGGGPPLEKVRLGPFQQFASDSLSPPLGMDQQLADHSIVLTEVASLFVASKSGVDHADQPVVLTGQDQSLVVEVGLGEQQKIEQVERDFCGTATSET